MIDLPVPPPWMLSALCAEIGPADVVWFPDKGGSTKAAKSICARCPVRAECAAWSLEQGIYHGIWGGVTERERRAIRKAAS